MWRKTYLKSLYKQVKKGWGSNLHVVKGKVDHGIIYRRMKMKCGLASWLELY